MKGKKLGPSSLQNSLGELKCVLRHCPWSQRAHFKQRQLVEENIYLKDPLEPYHHFCFKSEFNVLWELVYSLVFASCVVVADIGAGSWAVEQGMVIPVGTPGI